MSEKIPNKVAPEKFFIKSFAIKKLFFLVSLLLCLSSFVTPPVALLMGIIFAQVVGHPYLHLNSKATQVLLQVSVVGLGFGMNLGTVMKAGQDGILLTIISIFGILAIGYFLGKILKVERKTSFLISAGTAICGGSAIAAVSQAIKAEDKQISVALGTVFILNAAALFLFPYVGKFLQLGQTEFGLWCALSIHDTSSVVGAASNYGNESLQVATTVKLARALWIIPLVFLSSIIFKTKGKRINIPFFIGLFFVAILLNTHVGFVNSISHDIVVISKVGLTITLFLIGSGLSKKALSSVGFKPILQGVILWAIISTTTLLAIMNFVDGNI